MENHRQNQQVFWAACAGMLLFGIAFITLGSVTAALRAKFELNELAFGALFALLPLGIILGTLWFGPTADRYGYKPVFLLATFLLLLGFLGIGFATQLNLLKLCVFLFGFGGGAINGACNAVVVSVSPRNKVSRLSLLGVFYGIGALGMPFILGLMEGLSYSMLVAGVCALTLIVNIGFFWVRFPPGEGKSGLDFRKALNALRPVHIRWIAAFLFLQMSLEAVFNNWSTSYLSREHALSDAQALFGLSCLIFGMTLMRILIGSLFKSLSKAGLLWISLGLMSLGLLFLAGGSQYTLALAAMIALGAGLAAGIPLMLGIVGELFQEQAGTLFSAIIVIGLLGNVSVNYLMGFLTDRWGMQAFYYAIWIEWGIMVLLARGIIRAYARHQRISST